MWKETLGVPPSPTLLVEDKTYEKREENQEESANAVLPRHMRKGKKSKKRVPMQVWKENTLGVPPTPTLLVEDKIYKKRKEKQEESVNALIVKVKKYANTLTLKR